KIAARREFGDDPPQRRLGELAGHEQDVCHTGILLVCGALRPSRSRQSSWPARLSGGRRRDVARKFAGAGRIGGILNGRDPRGSEFLASGLAMRNVMGQRRTIAGLRMLITGASQGIGRALALEAVQQGVKVLAVARQQPLLDELAAEAKSLGG